MERKIYVDIESGLYMEAAFNENKKMCGAVGKNVQVELIELNSIKLKIGVIEKYYEVVECVGSLAEIKEVK